MASKKPKEGSKAEEAKEDKAYEKKEDKFSVSKKKPLDKASGNGKSRFKKR